MAHHLLMSLACSPAAIAVAVLRDNLRPEVPEDVAPEYLALMTESWDSDASIRPKFLEIMTRLESMVDNNSSTAYTGVSSWTSSSTAHPSGGGSLASGAHRQTTKEHKSTRGRG